MFPFHGQFCWCELLTTDAASATEFYRRVIGWNAADAGVPGHQYTILSAGETGMGGLMELPQSARDAGAQPGWIGYIAVDDVDAAAARVKDAGGSIHRAPEDIPGIGRFAMVKDPQGAAFTLFRPLDAGQ
jgi:predicted enzyme related to lactoylglutathione lyase